MDLTGVENVSYFEAFGIPYEYQAINLTPSDMDYISECEREGVIVCFGYELIYVFTEMPMYEISCRIAASIVNKRLDALFPYHTHWRSTDDDDDS